MQVYMEKYAEDCSGTKILNIDLQKTHLDCDASNYFIYKNVFPVGAMGCH